MFRRTIENTLIMMAILYLGLLFVEYVVDRIEEVPVVTEHYQILPVIVSNQACAGQPI